MRIFGGYFMTGTQLVNENGRKQIKELTEKVNKSEISSIRSVLSSIIRIINDPESSVKDLKDVIEIDPPLVAKILKVSNSAYYGYSKNITAIQEAIICIGFDAVREMALNQKVGEIFNESIELGGYSRRSLWKHLVAVALCCKLIYRREFMERGDNAYVAGLLHDIGLIVIEQFVRDEFKKIVVKAEENGVSIADLEKKYLGYQNSDVGVAMAELWGLPDELICGIGFHHKPLEAPEKYQRLSQTIYVSNYACLERKVGYCGSGEFEYHQYLLILKNLGIAKKAMEYIMQEVEKEITKMEEEDLL